MCFCSFDRVFSCLGLPIEPPSPTIQLTNGQHTWATAARWSIRSMLHTQSTCCSHLAFELQMEAWGCVHKVHLYIVNLFLLLQHISIVWISLWWGKTFNLNKKQDFEVERGGEFTSGSSSYLYALGWIQLKGLQWNGEDVLFYNVLFIKETYFGHLVCLIS